MDTKSKVIAVIGLGYVGLPVALAFGKYRRVIGFDLNQNRIAALQAGNDTTLECSTSELAEGLHLEFTSDPNDITDASLFIVTVPTPVDHADEPDTSHLINASITVGRALSKGDIVIYESTVYPGATEEVCVPMLEAQSGLKFNVDFFCGYSPERINPGDREHRLASIKKITSGSSPWVADEVDHLYQEIITAGTFKASSIRTAEAAKVIENIQRDINIGLINEFSLIFNKMGIDTLEVLQAAETKWNFLSFRPGLVGGHCIGVDPYYLMHKARQVGHKPEIILSGRRVNNSMASYIANETMRLLRERNFTIDHGHVLIMGLAFKENCPDIRNTKVIDIIQTFKDHNVCVDVCDPWVDLEQAKKEYGLDCFIEPPKEQKYIAVIFAVGHDQFIASGLDVVKSCGVPGAVVFDVKGILPRGMVDARL